MGVTPVGVVLYYAIRCFHAFYATAITNSPDSVLLLLAYTRQHVTWKLKSACNKQFHNTWSNTVACNCCTPHSCLVYSGL